MRIHIKHSRHFNTHTHTYKHTHTHTSTQARLCSCKCSHPLHTALCSLRLSSASLSFPISSPIFGLAVLFSSIDCLSSATSCYFVSPLLSSHLSFALRFSSRTSPLSLFCPAILMPLLTLVSSMGASMQHTANEALVCFLCCRRLLFVTYCAISCAHEIIDLSIGKNGS